jgi:hypothetical protein
MYIIIVKIMKFFLFVDGFYYCFHPVFDPDPKPRGYGSGSVEKVQIFLPDSHNTGFSLGFHIDIAETICIICIDLQIWLCSDGELGSNRPHRHLAPVVMTPASTHTGVSSTLFTWVHDD